MSGTLRTQLMALHPYGVTRRVPIGDTGLVLIVGNNGTAFRLESATGSVTFDADASELLAMTLRREHLTSERQWRDPPSYGAELLTPTSPKRDDVPADGRLQHIGGSIGGSNRRKRVP